MRGTTRKDIVIERRPKDWPVADLAVMERGRDEMHRECLACRPGPFRLEFELEPESTLVARLIPGDETCSYAATVHGGLLSLYFDEMATCLLFAHGIRAVTARLQVRYRRTVQPGRETVIRARVESVRGPTYRIRGWLEQAGRVGVTAVLDMWRQESNGQRPSMRSCRPSP